jgi:hypothetical protein
MNNNKNDATVSFIFGGWMDGCMGVKTGLTNFLNILSIFDLY